MSADWITVLIGGLLIGTAGAVYLLGTARDVLKERLAFIAALIGAPAVLFALGLEADTQTSSNWPPLTVAGLLVGIGTQICSGCTSGHGVCGISRLSLRGMFATCIYVGAGVLTVTALRGVL